MPQSFIRVILHTTFCTKFRRCLITPTVEPALHRFLQSRLEHMGCWVFEVGGTMDHVHLLHGLPRASSISSVMEDVKSRSSYWMKEQGYPKFQWQGGYGCHSVDYRRMGGIKRYIQNQKAHHYGSAQGYLKRAEVTFEEEFLHLLDQFDLPYKRKYVFPLDPEKRLE